jgi:hypothetical protein
MISNTCAVYAQDAYAWMCCSVVPLRCQVARRTPQRPHLCWTSFMELIM